jgi:hypothetical protein
MIEFDEEDDQSPALRTLRTRSAPAKEASPGQQLLEVLRQIPPLLSALLIRTPVVQVTTPAPLVPPAQVQVDVTVPVRPCRTVVCTIERDHDGKARTITFCEYDN